MAYCNPNFKTKKELRTAIANGRKVTVFSPGPFGCAQNGLETIEGPQFPESHKWYARVSVVDGTITKVLS